MMKKEGRICIDCNVKSVWERNRCKECALAYNRLRAKKYYKELGKQKREDSLPKEICPICNKEMIVWNKGQVSHLSCRPKVIKNYNKVPRDKKGNVYIRSFLIENGIDIPKGYVIHHVDENPLNNTVHNLWVLPRGAHNSLHRKLQTQRSLWLKNHNSNDENCWNTVRDHITTAWLEMTSANVIKICDIWQSAAEPLNFEIKYEEGSETMHIIPKSKDTVKI